jgi:hypothetical protein
MRAPSGGSHPGASAFVRSLVPALVAVSLLAATGCRFFGLQLQHTQGSPKAVAEAVVAALDRRDVAALEQLSVSELEFRRVVWPRQPAARPERNIPWEYAWRDLAAKSRYQLRARVAEWQPAAVTVVDVGFDGETTDYGTYRVMRKSRVTLRDKAGRLTTGRLFGSVIEQPAGHFKVFSYVVD